MSINILEFEASFLELIKAAKNQEIVIGEYE